MTNFVFVENRITHAQPSVTPKATFIQSKAEISVLLLVALLKQEAEWTSLCVDI